MTQRKRNQKREIGANAKNAEKGRVMDDAERKREGINHFLYDKSVAAARERSARRAEVMATGGSHQTKDGLTDEEIAAMFPNGGYSVKVVKPVNVLDKPMTIYEAVATTRNRVRLQMGPDGLVHRTVLSTDDDRSGKRRDGLRDPESGSSRFGPGGR